MPTHTTTIEREVAITVDYDYIPESRGHRDSYGAPEEPDEPPSIEINEVRDGTGKAVELTKDEEDTITDQIWDEIADDSTHFDED